MKAQGYPHKQDFNIASLNKTKKRGWWLVGYRKAETPKAKK